MSLMALRDALTTKLASALVKAGIRFDHAQVRSNVMDLSLIHI